MSKLARRRLASSGYRSLAVGLAAALSAACSGGSAPAVKASVTSVVQQAEATAAAVPNGKCDKPGFISHAGPALGAVSTYVWKPFSAGSFGKDAKGHAVAMVTGSHASAFASKEFLAAKPLITGCPSSIELANALATGSSLTKAVSSQLATGKVNAQSVGGANSLLSTITAQAARAGIVLKPVSPTAAQLKG